MTASTIFHSVDWWQQPTAVIQFSSAASLFPRPDLAAVGSRLPGRSVVLATKRLARPATLNRVYSLHLFRQRPDKIVSGLSLAEGLLSYALVHEGLESGYAAKNGKILLSEWLASGAQEAPNLFASGKVKGPKGENPTVPKTRDIIYLGLSVLGEVTRIV